MNKESNVARRENAAPDRSEGPFRTPPVDVCETNDALLLFADVPGVDEKGLEVSVEEDTLTIVGKPSSALPANAGVLYAECEPYAFRRAFTLSNDLQADAIEGSVKDGVLKLTLPKARGAKVRRIPVKSE